MCCCCFASDAIVVGVLVPTAVVQWTIPNLQWAILNAHPMAVLTYTFNKCAHHPNEPES